MANASGLAHALLRLMRVLPMLAAAACSPVGAVGTRFDVPAQAMGPALNEFARQADITLIFSYDLVASDQTHALKGRYSVDHGLSMLLEGTRFTYRRAPDGTYLICPRGGCARVIESRKNTSTPDVKADAGESGGNAATARLHD